MSEGISILIERRRRDLSQRDLSRLSRVPLARVRGAERDEVTLSAQERGRIRTTFQRVPLERWHDAGLSRVVAELSKCSPDAMVPPFDHEGTTPTPVLQSKLSWLRVAADDLVAQVEDSDDVHERAARLVLLRHVVRLVELVTQAIAERANAQ